jgi:signal peptidase
MIPTINIGDVVIIKHNNNNNNNNNNNDNDNNDNGSYSFNNLKIGDIIVFKSAGTTKTGQHLTIVHRVAAIRSDIHGNRIIITKGDANNGFIPLVDYPIRENNYIGKVLYIVPKIGIFGLMINRLVRYIAILIIIIIIIMTIILAYNFKKVKKKN